MPRQISEERTRKEMIDASTGFRQAQPASSARRPQLVRADGLGAFAEKWQAF